jgi:hypothetical protein
VFCTADEVPSINAVLGDLASQGFRLKADAGDQPDLDSVDWLQFGFRYADGKEPIEVECNRNTGEKSLCHEECAEFIEALENSETSTALEGVTDQLQKTAFVVACQLPSDIDDAGYEALGALLAHFVRHCGGMIQADGEGFYEGDQVILPM